MASGREPVGPSTAKGPAKRDPEPGTTPMRGVIVAVVILGGAALVFFVLALTSGALSL
ncbi:MAG TPA: hypothetical protein VIR16_01685 [Candidatus Limnocylindrales bacterium]